MRLLPCSNSPKGGDLLWPEGRCSIGNKLLVANCGGRMQGPFLWTLVATDIATGWSESAPILVRNGAVVLTALQLIRRQLPFPLRGSMPTTTQCS